MSEHNSEVSPQKQSEPKERVSEVFVLTHEANEVGQSDPLLKSHIRVPVSEGYQGLRAALQQLRAEAAKALAE